MKYITSFYGPLSQKLAEFFVNMFLIEMLKIHILSHLKPSAHGTARVYVCIKNEYTWHHLNQSHGTA